MRFFFFVSLSPFANTFCGEKREKRDERGERDSISPVRDVSEEKQKRIFEEYSQRSKFIDRFFFNDELIFLVVDEKKKVTENHQTVRCFRLT